MLSIARCLVGASSATVLATALVTAEADAQSRGGSSPFEQMSGSWTGDGQVTYADGAKESIRCRARYVVVGAGNTLQQQLRCASASYSFDLSSEVAYRGGSISGRWTESSRNVGGTVSGDVRGGTIEAVADAQNFSARLSISTSGDRQSVRLTARAPDLTQVSITLNRT
jgi:hypothetical protein